MGKEDRPIERTANLIGGKWTLLILYDLLEGKKRFGELRTSLASGPQYLSRPHQSCGFGQVRSPSSRPGPTTGRIRPGK